MKFKLLFLGLFFSLATFAQIQDLSTLANGKIVYTSTLYDNDDNLFGYLYLYEQEINKETKNIEFVFLDKNLNKVSNGTFVSKNFAGVSSRFYDCTLMGDNIILNKYYYYYSFNGSAVLLVTTFQTISLKDSKVNPEFQFADGNFVEFSPNYETMKSDFRTLEVKSIINAFSNESFKGLLITEDNKKKGYLEKEIKLFNEKNEKVWSFEYNPTPTKYDYNTFNVLYSHKNTIYVSTPKWEKNFYDAMVIKAYNIIALDLQTGAKKFDYLLEDSYGKYSHTLKMHQIDNKLILSGNYSPFESTDFSLDQNLGFYKIVLDEQGNEIEKRYTEWSEFASQIDVDKRGRVEKNYRLKPIKYFFFKDGKISILTEKFKYDSWAGATKSTDFVLFNMKADFTPDTINTIVKEKSYYSTDYLFSQYIKDKSGVVFFYSTTEKDPSQGFGNTSVMLGINTILDGKLTQEKIKLSARKKYSIVPYPAKEGYLMLREYNEKDKYNQLRLEKMNY